MIAELFILFSIGIALAFLAYFVKGPRWFRIVLATIGGLLIALPFLLMAYFAFILFTA